MSHSELPQPLRGIVPPMITPLSDRDTLDHAGLERLIEHILAGGVHGLFILGTTGEGPSLSYRLRQEVLDRTCSQVAGRVPVLVGITDTAFAESVALARRAQEKGAEALVLAAPYYFPISQAELLQYIEHLTKELPLPLFLYNMPSHTKAAFLPATVRAAADIPGIVGLKDSSADMAFFHNVQYALKDRPEFALLLGIEELLGEAVLMGCHGGVTGGANFCPKLYVDLYNAACAREMEKVRSLQARVMEISTRIYRTGSYGSSYLKGVKCALSCLGVCDDFMAEPFQRFSPEKREIIRNHLVAVGLLPGS